MGPGSWLSSLRVDGFLSHTDQNARDDAPLLRAAARRVPAFVAVPARLAGRHPDAVGGPALAHLPADGVAARARSRRPDARAADGALLALGRRRRRPPRPPP